MAFFKKPREDRRGKGLEKRKFDKRSFGAKDGAKAPLHKATCSECGNVCEVPFKPKGDKPIYCNRCFRKDEKGNSRIDDTTLEQFKEKLEILDIKLDRIMKALTALSAAAPAETTSDLEKKKVKKTKKSGGKK